MAGVEVDIREVHALLRGLQRAAIEHGALFWAAWKNKVKLEVRSHRRQVQDRSPATKEAHGRRPRLGKALTAYKTTTSADGVHMDSLLSWSGVLNDGGSVGDAAHRATLPARPFAYLSDAFLRTTADRYAAFLGGAA